MHRSTVTFQYDEVRLARWMERKIEEAGVQAIVGAVLTDVAFENRRVQHVEFATRFGAVRVQANGYVDSSGDATLCYEAGLDVREPDAPIYRLDEFPDRGLRPRAPSTSWTWWRCASDSSRSRLSSTGSCATTAG